jgi:O-antigen ligase/tetratricopeptide (TPR) repeat protein
MASADPTGDTRTANRCSQSTRSGEQRLGDSWTLSLVDAGIASALIIVPFFMGGRTSLGQFAFVCVASWTCFWWAIHQTLGNGDRSWRNTLAFWPMGLALGLVLLQVVPLAPSLVQILSPHIYEILPLWGPSAEGQATLGTWQTLSMTSDTTRQSLFLLVSGVLLFAVTIQRVQRVRDVERIIRWLAISVSLMAVFGIVQFLTSNGKFFWFYEHPYSNTDGCVKGAFTNRNHFSQFIALGFGAVLWWVYGGQAGQPSRSSSRSGFRSRNSRLSLENALKAILVPLCVLAVLMSFSRGGVLALLVSCVTALFLLQNAGRLSRQTFAVLAGSGLVVCLGLSIYGYDALSSRFESAKSLASLDDRSRLWAAACEGFADHPLCGTGLSSHCSVYPIYLTPQPGDSTSLYYTHAENGYVQMALETGTIGLGLALVVLGFYFFWCARTLSNEGNPRNSLCFVAVLPALLANTVHSATDFVWYVPACMGVIAVLGACACRLYQLERHEAGVASPGWRVPHLAWAGMAIALVTAVGVSLPVLWQGVLADGPWNRYLALKRSLIQFNRTTAYDDVQDESETRKEILSAQLDELASVLGARPNWAEAQACKAEVHRDLFHEFQSTAENEFDLRMIRETVRDNFDSVEEAREWLPRGIGEHCVHLDAALRHAHRALELDPLQGEGYLTLAQLAFLEGSSVPSKSAYAQQAFRVRPHHGDVLFEIGNEMTLSGRPDQALKYLKRSFAQGAVHQRRLIQALSGNVPAQIFLQEFRPDADAMQIMVQHYRRPELEAELECVLVNHAIACEFKAKELSGAEAAKYWGRAASSYGKMRNMPRQRACLQNSVTANATNFDTRLAFGEVCLTLDDYVEAEKQLRWCVQRKPGHPRAERLLERAVRERIASTGRSKPMHEAGRNSGNARR